MKTFSKPAIIVIGILSTIIVILVYLLYSKLTFPPSEAIYSQRTGPIDSETKDMDYKDAILCKRKYNELKTGLIQTTGKEPDKPLKDLQGWRLNLKTIKPLMEKGAQELFLLPIMQPESQNNNKPSETIISMLIAGITPTPDDSGKILFSRTAPNLFFEYLRPCPDNCPKNYYEILNDPEVK